jgi:Leucine-rich repeat (LRR) protein
MVGTKPGPLSVKEAYNTAQTRIDRARKQRAKEVDLSLANLKTLPSLANLPHLRVLTIRRTKITDFSSLKELHHLERLDLSQSKILSLEPISHLSDLETLQLWHTNISDLTPIAGLKKLKALDCALTDISDVRPLEKLSALTNVDISHTKVADIHALKAHGNLQVLDISGTAISDLSSLSDAAKLRHLDLSSTKVTDLRPLAELKNLSGKYHQGLDFKHCPIANKTIQLYAELRNPDRTKMTLAYLRNHPHDDAQISDEPTQHQKTASELSEPLDNIPSPVEFDVTTQGKISAFQSAENAPFLPLPANKKDHSDRLEACRVAAQDIIGDLSTFAYQARIEYLSGLQRYVDRLPTSADDGNILLADAAARMLRGLFAAEADFLSPAFGSALKVFLEQHRAKSFLPRSFSFLSRCSTRTN